MIGQMSLFDADGAEPTVDDLDGLLFGPGHVVSREGTARVSVLTDDAWRAEALVSEFAKRGLGGEYDVSRDKAQTSQFVARTDFNASLAPIARRWSPAVVSKNPPLKLTPGALRLWVMASGRPAETGYLLPLAVSEDARWAASGAALARLGLAGVLIGPRGGGPAYRITSAKRLVRLSLLVGEAPAATPATIWP